MKTLKKRDLIFIGSLLIISIIGFFIVHYYQKNNGSTVTITIDGTLYGTYPLNQDQTIDIKDEAGHNTIVIKNQSVYMDSADCPDQYCVKHAAITHENESIICLPHKLIVEIDNGKSSDIDATVN